MGSTAEFSISSTGSFTVGNNKSIIHTFLTKGLKDKHTSLIEESKPADNMQPQVCSYMLIQNTIGQADQRTDERKYRQIV